MAAPRIVDNGPFDSRITSIPFTANAPGWQGNKLTRGWIIQEKPVNGIRYRTNFLYNPSVIDLSHSVNPNVIANQDAQNPYDVTKDDFLMPLQQTLSFSLLFDRTYELWDSSNLRGDASDMVPTHGVAWDVLSLYKITGIAANLDVTQAQSGGANSGAAQSSSFSKGQFTNGASGPMLYVPVFAVFGNTLDFYGVIQELDVQYTHWTQYMVPARCQVSITMQLLPRAATQANPRPYGPSGNGIPGMPSGATPPTSILTPTNTGRGGR